MTIDEADKPKEKPIKSGKKSQTASVLEIETQPA
jgi:hypothetical protein